MNTTDMIITCFDESDVVAGISKKTDINFIKISDATKSGGSKVLIFESFGACYKSLGSTKIDEIISTFKSAPFAWPGLAVLIIDDDDDYFSGIILREVK